MAATVLRTPTFQVPPFHSLFSTTTKCSKPLCVSLTQRHDQRFRRRCRMMYCSPNSSNKLTQRVLGNKFVLFASHGETAETQVESETQADGEERVQEPELQDNSDGAVNVEEGAHEVEATDLEDSIVISSLQSYKEALASSDDSKITEIEAFFKSIEIEKRVLEKKVASLSKELSSERDRVLRISADFDNFRKRTERERLSMVTNAQGEVLENLLSVLDNFERARTQIKAETEGEEKIKSSYQSIYKQFVEILASLGVAPVETVGNPFDPLLHEAIMREDSSEFEEGIIIEEYRKGFKLGNRLLRPSMVKVSAGPGPAKPESAGRSEDANEALEEGSMEPESTE